MRRSDYLRQKHIIEKNKRNRGKIILAIVILLIFALIICRISPLYDSIAWRYEEFRTKLFYQLNPPDEAIFSPEQSEELDFIVQATLNAMTPTFSRPDSTPQPTGTSGPTPTPTITPTPGPDYVFLEGVTYVHQHGLYNYCAPANLAMGLKFWDWPGSRNDIGRAIKSGPNDPNMDNLDKSLSDSNVMPYEMVDFVNDQTEFRALQRFGGDIELLKRLIANGFPVIIEKGYYTWSTIAQDTAWMGHYLFITGYDEIEEAFIVQDAYLKTGDNGTGANIHVDYNEFTEEWRYFNYLFMVVYPPEKEGEVYQLLGPWVDSDWATHHALDTANDEITKLSVIDEFFAWFNKGTSHVYLREYVDAAFAYDYAFLLYANLPTEDRPYRIMWYQTGPYFAYYYSTRYQDVINLANTTLDAKADPTLEESIYWRGLARLAIGEVDNAITDFRRTVYLNPNFAPGWDMLNQLGVGP